eukprot:TRINITY_DN32132_c0_g1_i1.p1 TRINITY_DN32132_c0_g1~~TRINITY_DN32132_c0_g1_i1.p1  ORF type:complete len:151 (-),score=24.39 TRINITY_DN32132_c0_g1_i1:272-724(-)
MTMDTYMDRVRLLLAKYVTDARRMSIQYYILQVCIIVTGSLATLLAANGCELAVPLVLSCSSALTAMTQHLRLKPRLGAVNAAVAALQGCVVFWVSCGIVDRRTQSTRNYLVEVTENAALSVAMADAGTFSVAGETGAHKKVKADAKKKN